MENNIDKIMVLIDGNKYMVMDQGNYGGKAYYFVSKLDKEDNLTEEFNIFENNDGIVSNIIDGKVLEALKEYFMKRIEN